MGNFIDQFCSEEWKKYLSIHHEVIGFKKNEYVFKAGEKMQGIFVISSGKVKITYQQYNGADRLIRLAKEGDIIGHRGFGGDWVYPISALTLEETTTIFIPVDVFATVLKADSYFSYNVMMFFAEELRVSEAKIKHYPVKNLVARAILENHKAFDFEKNSKTKIAYTLSRSDFASMAGTTYETVVRCITQMQKDGIVKNEGKSIHILNLKKLEKLAHPVRMEYQE